MVLQAGSQAGAQVTGAQVTGAHTGAGQAGAAHVGGAHAAPLLNERKQLQPVALVSSAAAVAKINSLFMVGVSDTVGARARRTPWQGCGSNNSTPRFTLCNLPVLVFFIILSLPKGVFP